MTGVDVHLEWINHAGYILQYQEIALVVDPWLFGPVFDEGWDLLVETRFHIPDFRRTTHIWFSHEHPDHFAPPVLSKIPVAVREKITVLFQETRDKRVVNFCKQLGFPVIELEHRKRFQLTDGMDLVCGKVLGIDSWLLCEVDGLKILNLNDCVIKNRNQCESIYHTTGEVDILLTQFSYANWVGNEEDQQMRIDCANETLDRIKVQIEVFQPDKTIPFASFIYFSHHENRYLNDCINTVMKAHEFINNETPSESLVFYPEDTWDCVSPHSSDRALTLYAKAYNNLHHLPYREPKEPVGNEELTDLGNQYLAKIKKQNSPLAMSIYEALKGGKDSFSIVIEFMDTGEYCQFDWKKGLQFLPGIDGEPDAKLSTCSLKQIFQFEWGIGSVLVNGRYRTSPEGNMKLNNVFMLGLWNSANRYLTLWYFLEKVINKLLGKIETDEAFSFDKSWNKFLGKHTAADATGP